MQPATQSFGVDTKARSRLCQLIRPCEKLSNGINDRIMTLRLPLSGNKHSTIISVYAPTKINPDEVKDKFYDDIDIIVSATPRTDKLILLCDLNARVGTDHQTWEGVKGSEGVGKCSSNSLLLLRKCAEHDLLLTITVFNLPNRNKTSWMHPQQDILDASPIQTLGSHRLCHSEENR